MPSYLSIKAQRLLINYGHWGRLVESLIRAGELDSGIEIQSDLLPKFRVVRSCIGEVESLLCLGEGYYLVGEYNKAKQILKERLNLSDRCGMKFYVAGARRLLGEITFIKCWQYPYKKSHSFLFLQSRQCGTDYSGEGE